MHFQKAKDHINQQYNELTKRIHRAQELSILRQKLEIKKKLQVRFFFSSFV